MADRAPNPRDPKPAPATTPRPPSPPPSTGRPCSVGRVSCSTDAKNASMSRCSTQRESTITDAIALTSLSMAMNLCHRVFCSSHRYFRSVENTLLPWTLADVHLGDNVLELGPGYGA